MNEIADKIKADWLHHRGSLYECVNWNLSQVSCLDNKYW